MTGVSQKQKTRCLFPPRSLQKPVLPWLQVSGGPMCICYMPFLFISVNSFEAFGPTWFLLLGGFYPETEGN
jgi:hypothetical protein